MLRNPSSDLEATAAVRYIIDKYRFREVVVLDALSAARFIIDLEDVSSVNILRILQTRAGSSGRSRCCKRILEDTGADGHARDLEVGNIIAGATSCVIVMCEARSTPAVALFSIRESAFAVEESKRFEVI